MAGHLDGCPTNLGKRGEDAADQCGFPNALATSANNDDGQMRPVSSLQISRTAEIFEAGRSVFVTPENALLYKAQTIAVGVLHIHFSATPCLVDGRQIYFDAFGHELLVQPIDIVDHQVDNPSNNAVAAE